MTKQEIINEINRITREAGLEHCGVIRRGRQKKEFERLLPLAWELASLKIACTGLEAGYDTVEITFALMDGTDDPVLQQVLEYRRKMTDLMDEIGLG